MNAPGEAATEFLWAAPHDSNRCHAPLATALQIDLAPDVC